MFDSDAETDRALEPMRRVAALRARYRSNKYKLLRLAVFVASAVVASYASMLVKQAWSWGAAGLNPALFGILVMLGFFWVGSSLLFLRSGHKGVYGYLEIVVAVAMAQDAIKRAIAEPTTGGLAMMAALYVLVRGKDNQRQWHEERRDELDAIALEALSLSDPGVDNAARDEGTAKLLERLEKLESLGREWSASARALIWRR